MRSKSILVLAALVFSLGAKAETITIFDSNATISDGESYDVVVVKGNGTEVNMTSGDVNTVITMNASTFNMSGGNIAGVSYSYDSSTLNLTDGYAHVLFSANQSNVNLSGNFSMIGYVSIAGSSVATVSGNAIVSIDINNSSILNITGGACPSVFCYSRKSRINISGGTIGMIGVWAEDYEGEIDVFGYDLNAVPYGGSDGNGQISGYWNDSNAFTIDLSHLTYAYIALHEGGVPTECTNKPESDVSGDCKVTFTDFSKMASEWLECGLDPPEACWE